jgi:ribosomal-protein-alanine N-acetyltransferase
MGGSMPKQKQTRDELFAKFPILETERLVLKEIKPEHAEDLLKVRGDIDGAKYGPAPWTDLQYVKKRINDFHQDFMNKEGILWGVFYKGGNQLIGHFRYSYLRQYLGMIGYHFGVEHWNKGIGTEVLRYVLDYLYINTDAHRIQATVHKGNFASMRILEKVGFRNEGLLRDRAFWQDKFCDLYM